MVFVLVGSCALLTAILAVALLREARLRRALEQLLRRILTRWRHFDAKEDKPQEDEQATFRADTSADHRL
jgi:hypothetical protein